jgi:hypothetical protein
VPSYRSMTLPCRPAALPAHLAAAFQKARAAASPPRARSDEADENKLQQASEGLDDAVVKGTDDERSEEEDEGEEEEDEGEEEEEEDEVGAMRVKVWGS